MEGQIDSHQWVSKMEVQHVFSGKPDVEIEEDIQTANDEARLLEKSLPARVSSLFKRAGTECK